MSKVYVVAVSGPALCLPNVSGVEISIPGFFAGVNANFGFNNTPHKFDVDITKNTYSIDGSLNDLPEIGEFARFYIGPDFFHVAGRVLNTSYTNGMNGTTISISVQDRRTDLDNIVVFSEEVGDNDYLASLGAVSVNSFVLKNIGHVYTNDEYDRINEDGCTYRQLYDAVVSNASLWIDIGLTPKNVLPPPSIIESNLLVIGSGTNISVDNFRWQFNGVTLKEALTTIFDDFGFDWYWDMAGDKVALINRAHSFLISEDNVPIPGDTAETIQVTFGIDNTEAEKVVGLVGAKQEGFIDSDLLSPIDGLTTPSGLLFTPAWRNISVDFYDADGVKQSYIPSDIELAFAVRSMDMWAFFKKYQSRPAYWNLPSDAGVVAARHRDFHSRFDDNYIDSGLLQRILLVDNVNYLGIPDRDDVGCYTGEQIDVSSLNTAVQDRIYVMMNSNGYYDKPRIIANRRDESQNWILQWFNKIESHAKDHFARTYVASGVLGTEYGSFRPIAAAWCNLENQLDASQSGFVDGYKIDSTYNVLSPLAADDFRVRAHIRLPEYTLYGSDGNDAPAAFDEWNEDIDTGHHFVPVDVFEVDNTPKNPRDFTLPYEAFPRGSIIMRLPTIVGEEIIQDPITVNNRYLQALRANNGHSRLDTLSPEWRVKPYPYFNGAISVPEGAHSSLSLPIKLRLKQKLQTRFVLFRNASGVHETSPVVQKDSLLSAHAAAASVRILANLNRWTGKVAIPVISNKRYGAEYPEVWTSNPSPSGILSKKFYREDKFAPWNYPAKGYVLSSTYSGPGTSVVHMNASAKNYIDSKSNRAASSRHASVQKVGFPVVSFDNFAIQDFSDTGIFAPFNHGITSMSTSFGMNGIQTNYELKSYYSEFGMDAPLGKKLRGLLDRIIHPIEWKPLPFETISMESPPTNVPTEEDIMLGYGGGGGGGEKKKPKLVVEPLLIKFKDVEADDPNTTKISSNIDHADQQFFTIRNDGGDGLVFSCYFGQSVAVGGGTPAESNEKGIFRVANYTGTNQAIVYGDPALWTSPLTMKWWERIDEPPSEAPTESDPARVTDPGFLAKQAVNVCVLADVQQLKPGDTETAFFIVMDDISGEWKDVTFTITKKDIETTTGDGIDDGGVPPPLPPPPTGNCDEICNVKGSFCQRAHEELDGKIKEIENCLRAKEICSESARWTASVTARDLVATHSVEFGNAVHDADIRFGDRTIKTANIEIDGDEVGGGQLTIKTAAPSATDMTIAENSINGGNAGNLTVAASDKAGAAGKDLTLGAGSSTAGDHNGGSTYINAGEGNGAGVHGTIKLGRISKEGLLEIDTEDEDLSFSDGFKVRIGSGGVGAHFIPHIMTAVQLSGYSGEDGELVYVSDEARLEIIVTGGV